MPATTNGQTLACPVSLPQVHVTGQNDQGQAIVQWSYECKETVYPEHGLTNHHLYTTANLPVDLNNDVDIKDHKDWVAAGKYGLTRKNGTVCRYVNFAPSHKPLYHRTQSLDFGLVIEGSVVLHLDDGSETFMKKGDVVVQRATWHAWSNPSSTEWARMVFVLQDCNATQLLYVTGISTGSSLGGENTFAAELRRRRFWACYLVHCHTTEKQALFEPIGDIKQVPLPWPEDDFQNLACTNAHTYLEAKQANGGVFAELIRIMTLWASVVALLKNSEIRFGDRVTQIHSLHDKLEHWRQQLPTHLQLTPLRMAQSADFVPNILLINIIYHQSLCGLHASIVPLYSWGGSGDGSWLTARQLSAQIAFEHASTLSAFFDVLLSRHSHILSATSNFIAHAAHCACVVQMPYMWCRNSAVRALASNNVKVNAKMIHVLAKYWRFASLLEVHLSRLHRLHKKHPSQPEDEPKFSDPKTLMNCQTRASSARANLLEFFGILRRREGGGYVKSGEEDAFRVEEDETESSSASSLLVHAEKDPQSQTSSNAGNLNAGINTASAGPYEDPMPGVEPQQEDPSSMATLPAQWPDLFTSDSQTFDMFYPFLDPGYLDHLGEANVGGLQGNGEDLFSLYDFENEASNGLEPNI
ncbi:hypothetical protein H2200_001260 [Cladophialophora chaetospira]|uniref:Cupin type-2 domain-containing protein n=1 Tax=Cladophialophora chaetospira TaxID=386627 RepID=A0AA38XKL8_9EURO|nr:hypothetical protein H2200_001260 [Cladophialophora chaetospira]